MVSVKKLNVRLDIADDALPKYLKMGYSQIDSETGEVLIEAVPNDINTLRLAFVQHKKEIESLNKEIKSLKSKLKKAQKADKAQSDKAE